MIDIHCHILPKIDDGPSTIQESLEMAKIASSDGITTIVATPHIKDNPYSSKIVRDSVSLLNMWLDELEIPVKVLCGAEVNAFLDPLLMMDYAIQGTNYILLEFPHTHLPRNAKDIIFNLAIKGFRSIISHPERNPSVIKNPELLRDLVDANALVQITAGSLVGDFGIASRDCAKYLLKKGMVSFIATDAHSSGSRQPVLTEGLKVAEKLIGKENAWHLVMTNPEAVTSGSILNVA